MTDLARPVRQELAAAFMVSRPVVTRRLVSRDGTIKWLLRFPDGNEAETVYIPEDDRGTLCISSQVGCTLTRTFCHTGTQKLVRNLTVAEITGQIMLAMDELGDWPAGKEDRRLTNIVLMGMGEPLFNYDNVASAMRIAMSGEGIGLSKRRITLSTSGVVPEIDRTGADLGVNLAISLHAVRDELRNELVPINRKYPLDVLLKPAAITLVFQTPAASHGNMSCLMRLMTVMKMRGLIRLDQRHPVQAQSHSLQSMAGQPVSVFFT